ncbi:hypothetical protein AVEN_161577-1 [Araneus ventricosus]|uniref:Transposase Tc1-like domain-containing protein n=1 Tax=Araneus ventricosus TaxID=182803 RepID=A0A4Y2FHH9_ARAVE|nr:hypothetical protein AVEN_161577-1 [Araneus ventricosus]
MGKAADLSEFDRGQIVMARRLGTSFTETARLVGCSRSAVVSIHAKWINDGDTSSKRQSVGSPHVMKEKGRRWLSRLVKQNRHPTVAQLTAQYNADPSASVSEHTVQRTLLDMGLCSRRPNPVLLLTKHHRPLRLQWARDERKRFSWLDESRFLIHHVDGCVRVRHLPGEQLLPSCTAGHTQAGGGGIMLWRTFSRVVLGPDVVVEQTMKAANYLNIIGSVAPLHGVCLPNWKWNLPAGQTPHVTRLGLCWSGPMSILMNST